jgi:hypothetical protein
MAGIERRRPMGTTQAPGPWAGVLLSDEEALQIIAVLADVLMAATCAMRSAPPGRCSVIAWPLRPA